MPDQPDPNLHARRDRGHVAVLEPAYVGDVVFTGALVRCIKRAWRGCRVTLIARPGPVTLGKGLGYHRTVSFDKRGVHRGLAGVDVLVQQLQRLEIGTLIVPHRSARSALLAYRSKIPVRIGFGGDLLGVPLSRLLARAAYSHTVPPPRDDETYTDQLLRLLQPLEIPPSEPLARYRTSARAKTLVTDLLENAGADPQRVVALAPGAVWPTKRWPVHGYARLADELIKASYTPVVLASAKEQALLEEIRAGMVFKELLVDAVGTSLDEAAEVMRRSRAVVAGDTGLLHLGLAVGARAVALFGPTDPARHRFPPEVRVLTEDLACRPCSAHGQRRCPEQHHHCLQKLDASRVAKATLELIGA